VHIEYSGKFAATSAVCKFKHAQALRCSLQFIPFKHFSVLTSVVGWAQSFILPRKCENDADSFCYEPRASFTRWNIGKKRQVLTPGERNVLHDLLVDAAKVFLPPLHIKLGLLKNFERAMKKDGFVFYICSRNSPIEWGKDKRRDFLLAHK
jgi:hypothetical protein